MGLASSAGNLLGKISPTMEAKLRLWRRVRISLTSGEPELRFAHLLCRRDRISVDVGANLGIYSSICLPYSKAVVALEPHPGLAAHLRRWGRRKLEVREIAASDHDGEVVLHVPLDGRSEQSGMSTLEMTPLIEQLSASNQVTDVRVKQTPIDAMGLEPIGFLKVDVEGHEAEVIKGALKTIEKDAPNVLVEAEERHRAGSLAAISSMLASLQYSGFFVLNSTLRPIEEFDPNIHQVADEVAFSVRRADRPYINNFLFLRDRQIVGKLQAALGKVTIKFICTDLIHTPRARPRVLISHQGCVPIYRQPFYDRLARSPEVDYVVAVGPPPRGTDYVVAPLPFTFQTAAIRNFEVSLGRKTLIWQPLAAKYWTSFDAVVLGEELKYVSHLALAAISKVRRRPLIWWGFGAPPASWHPLLQFVTRQIRRSASGYLAYTESGREALRADGFANDSIAVLNNTVDVDRQREFRHAVAHENDASVRAAMGVPDGLPVLLYFGRFLADKQIDVLIRYVQSRRGAANAVSALIFGDGAEKEPLLALAGGAPDIVFRTQMEQRGDLDLARALKIASAIVIPGFVGLAITHGFAHGVPTITRVGVHPPEMEYMRHGENGLVLPEDEPGFFSGLDAFIASSEMQQKLRAGASQSASHLTIDAMAARFDTLVQKLLTESGRLSPHG